MRLIRCAVAFAITTCLLARALGAQVVAGTVVAPDGRTPVTGVIVVAYDERGSAVARGLTTERGAFSIRLPADGAYVLRLLRIGYRPTNGPTVHVAAGFTETVRVTFADEAVRLAEIDVRERETCRVSTDTGLAVARLWEEARKAMLTTQLGAAGPALVAEWIEYDRVLDSTARIVRDQRVRTSRNPTTHAFRSLSADLLAARGYVVEDATGTTYYAPDADVLLSDSFVATHCFRLEAPRAPNAGLIGVGFQPTRDRRGRHDIEGVLWLDRANAELRSMEFVYINLPEATETARPGGSVEFLRLDDGRWLVSRWSVRMPQLGARDRPADTGPRQVLLSDRRPVLRGVQVTGGEVTRVERRDSVVYRSSGARVALQVIAQDTLLPAAAARVTLEGTDYAAAADRTGRVELAPVLPGRYRARVQTSLMDSLGLAPAVREVEARADARVDSLTLPSARDALAKSCPRDSVRHGEAMLRGRVRDSRAAAVKNAAVVVTWQTNVAIVGAADADRLRWTEQTIGTLTDDSGIWRLCGVPRGSTLAVRAVADSGTDLQRVRLTEDQSFASIDLVIRRQVAALNREAEAALGKAPLTRALVELIVTDLHAAPLADATLEISPSSGSKRTVVTGSGGRALVPDVAPGVIAVRARRLGFRPGQVAVSVEPGRNTVPIMLSDVASPMLDTVRIIGDRRTWSRLDEFETRRVNRQATVSITRADIERRNPPNLWQMLAGIPSIQVADIDTMVIARSTRSLSMRPDGTVESCFLTVMIDGTVMNADALHKAYDLRMLPPPDAVHGIEVFAGPSSIPLQYGGVGTGKWCGMIAIWTR